MPPTPVEAFAAHLRRLDDGLFRRFVADLWAADGWEVTADGPTLVVRDGDARLVLFVFTPSWWRRSSPPAETDVFVTRAAASVERLADRHDATVLDDDDLAHRALYGLDRRECDALCRHHFGRGVDSLSTGRRRPGLPFRRLALVVFAATLLVGGAVAGPLTPQAPSSPAGTTGGVATQTERSSTTSTGGLASACSRSPRATVERQLRALRRNDPETNDGVRTVWESGTVEFRRHTGTFDHLVRIVNQRPFDALVGHEGVIFGPPNRSGSLVRLPATVDDGDHRDTFVWTLAPGQARDDCWLVDGITYRRDGLPDHTN